MSQGQRRAEYAIVFSTTVIEMGARPTHTSAQKAELIALTRALLIT